MDQAKMNSNRSCGRKSNGRVTHSEIEKRRREKLNKFLFELVPYLPINDKDNNSKKLDKITILKMAVQHMKYLKSSNDLFRDSVTRKNLISDNELRDLMLNEKDRFIIVLKCDTYKIVYASKSCYKCIGYSEDELKDKIFFKLVHQFDNKDVKDQLNFTELLNLNSTNNYQLEKPTVKIIGNRRAFTCRILYNSHSRLQNDSDSNPEYQIVRFTGYVKYEHNPNCFEGSDIKDLNTEFDVLSGFNYDTYNNMVTDKNKFFLILHGEMAENKSLPQDEFTIRTDIDSTILNVEPQCHLLIGYLAHELVNTPYIEYIHPEDQLTLKKFGIEGLKTKQKVKSDPIRFRAKNGSYALVDVTLNFFENPFTKELQYIFVKVKLLKPAPQLKNQADISLSSPAQCTPSANSTMIQTANSTQLDYLNSNADYPFTPSQVQANEFMRVLANDNYEINEPYSNQSSIPIASMNQTVSGYTESSEAHYAYGFNFMP